MNQSMSGRRSTSGIAARWLLWGALIVALLSALAVTLPGPLYRFGLVQLRDAFELITYAAYGGIGAIGFGAIALIANWIAKTGLRHQLGAAVALVVGLLAWGVPYMWMKRAESLPPIHDITTDTRNPPQFQPDVLALRTAAHAANSPVYGGSRVAKLQRRAYPNIRPMDFDLPVDKVFAAALRTVKRMGWKLDSQNRATGIIEASSRTFWFGFTDDVVIRIESQDGRARLDIRSESRIGASDLGRNAQRIGRFRAALYRELGLPLPAM